MVVCIYLTVYLNTKYILSILFISMIVDAKTYDSRRKNVFLIRILFRTDGMGRKLLF